MFDRSKAHAEQAKELHTQIFNISFCTSSTNNTKILISALDETKAYLDSSLLKIQDDAAHTARLTVTAGRFAQLLENFSRYLDHLQMKLRKEDQFNLQNLPERFANFIEFVTSSLQAYIDSNKDAPPLTERTFAAQAAASAEKTYSENKPMFMGAAAAAMLFVGAGTAGVTFAAGGFLSKAISFFDQGTIKQKKTMLAESLLANIQQNIAAQLTTTTDDADVLQKTHVLTALINQTMIKMQIDCKHKTWNPLDGRLGPMLMILKSMTKQLHEPELRKAQLEHVGKQLATDYALINVSTQLADTEQSMIQTLSEQAMQTANVETKTAALLGDEETNELLPHKSSQADADTIKKTSSDEKSTVDADSSQPKTTTGAPLGGEETYELLPHKSSQADADTKKTTSSDEKSAAGADSSQPKATTGAPLGGEKTYEFVNESITAEPQASPYADSIGVFGKASRGRAKQQPSGRKHKSGKRHNRR